jgi:hypothetical protein
MNVSRDSVNVHCSAAVCTETAACKSLVYKGCEQAVEYSVIRLFAMLILAGILDDFTVDNTTQGLQRLWFDVSEFLVNIGPGTLVLGAVALGAVYYFIVRPR